ncbi:MAG: hypothetical protein P4L51_20065 [Puia sp.]|nr:hypothetical protein [Puia sp.]
MKQQESEQSDDRSDRGSAKHYPHNRAQAFGPNEYSVRTGIDVTAEGPGAATIAAIEGLGLRDAEAFCFHVEQLKTGKKWYVDLSPSGEAEVQGWDEKDRTTTKLSS